MGFAAWNVNIRAQGDNGRHREFIANGTEKMTRFFDDNGFTSQHQIDRARHGDYRQRLPTAAIEEKDTPLQNDNPPRPKQAGNCRPALGRTALVYRPPELLGIIGNYRSICAEKPYPTVKNRE
jgi:hypothetical protein